MSLSPSELKRYDRQILLPEIGLGGQLRLKNARVLIVGVGGLGSPSALYLAAAGVGHLGLVDDDSISLSNLQRQVLYNSKAIGKKKVTEARERLLGLNPEIEIELFPSALTSVNAEKIFTHYDLVLDGTDNFKTRALIGRACLKTGKPHVYAGIFKFEGQVAVFDPGKTACYRCLFPKTPETSEIPNCSEAGVLGALPGIIGSAQALEAMKWILGFQTARSGQLFVFDALHLESRTLKVPRRPDCPACGPNAENFEVDPLEQTQNALQISDVAQAQQNAIWLDVRSEQEFSKGHQPGALNIPVATLADEISRLNRSQTYVVYCASGQRSLTAQTLMLRQGFKDVWNLRSGLGF